MVSFFAEHQLASLFLLVAQPPAEGPFCLRGLFFPASPARISDFIIEW